MSKLDLLIAKPLLKSNLKKEKEEKRSKNILPKTQTQASNTNLKVRIWS